MKICHCEYCNGTSIKGVAVNVEVSASTHCSHCYHSHQTKKHLFFCSPECFLLYVKAPENFETVVKEFEAGQRP